MRQDLLGRIERTHKHIHEREEVSANFSEQSVERSNDEVIMQLDADGRDELRLIDDALERIGEGDYGLCTECGKPINDNRLKAIPYAAWCIECASAKESR
ncbi:MAG: TraR/DksA family transcriptional regulator [Gammaproteobacteria bacterium]|nr:TraR/DksA family transcriptional regulator [Gammaproteobacteria bacterium]